MSTPQLIQTAPRRYQLFIDGQFVDAESGETFKSPNPATGETFAEVAEADKADVDKAVAAARKAFEGKWSKMSARDRGRLLYKLSQLIEQRAAELAELETRDNGKPIRESTYIDLPGVVENFEYFAGWPTKIEGETIPVPGQMFNYTLREPVGVCGQIIPWNFPLLMAAWKLAPALAAGNTVVLKPAEQTPVTALELGKLIQEAGFPDGVVNIVPGYGETAGAALASHSGVNKITVGDPLDKATQMGPQVSQEQLNRVRSYVAIGREEGATVLTGGDPPKLEGNLQNGYFFQPTILSEVKNQMRIAQEEIFGPVISVITFTDEDDLIKQANETIYGLSAGIWTRDITRAHHFAKEVKAGVIWINTFNMFNAASPFGGYKQSGYGREMGKHALELYTQVKSVWVDLSGKPIVWFGI